MIPPIWVLIQSPIDSYVYEDKLKNMTHDKPIVLLDVLET